MSSDIRRFAWIRQLQNGKDPTTIRWIGEDMNLLFFCEGVRSCCILELDMDYASLSFLYRETESKDLVQAAVMAATERGIRYIDIVDNSTHCD